MAESFGRNCFDCGHQFIKVDRAAGSAELTCPQTVLSGVVMVAISTPESRTGDQGVAVKSDMQNSSDTCNYIDLSAREIAKIYGEAGIHAPGVNKVLIDSDLTADQAEETTVQGKDTGDESRAVVLAEAGVVSDVEGDDSEENILLGQVNQLADRISANQLADRISVMKARKPILKSALGDLYNLLGVFSGQLAGTPIVSDIIPVKDEIDRLLKSDFQFGIFVTEQDATAIANLFSSAVSLLRSLSNYV